MSRYGSAVAMLVLGLLGCSSAGRPSPPTTEPGLNLAAGTGVTADDWIDGLDLDVDARGALHVVWRQRGTRDGGAGQGRILYRHGSGSPLRWGPAVVVAQGVDGMPQVAARADGAHVIAGSRLGHWFVDGKGGAVTTLGELLPVTGLRAGAFDAAAVDGGVAVIFRAANLKDGPAPYGLHWTSAGTSAAAPVAGGSPASSPARAAPELVRSGSRLFAVWSEPRPVVTHDAATGVTAYRPAEEIHAASSADGGREWAPTGVVATVPGSDIADIAAVGPYEAPIVLFAAHGLFAVRSAQGGWSPAVQVADHGHQSPGGATEVTAVAAAACDGGPAVAWVDARYRRTDRRWWNPLGGSPWSDDPDWDHNDVFVLPPASPPGGPAPSPLRLTADASFTGSIAMARHGAGLVVLHAGRAGVGKSRHSSGGPPHVLESRIPCG